MISKGTIAMNINRSHLVPKGGRFMLAFTTLWIDTSVLQFILQSARFPPQPGGFESRRPKAAHVNADPEDLGINTN